MLVDMQKVDKDVHEDWHMWLRMIEKGLYPVRMNFMDFGIALKRRRYYGFNKK